MGEKTIGDLELAYAFLPTVDEISELVRLMGEDGNINEVREGFRRLMIRISADCLSDISVLADWVTFMGDTVQAVYAAYAAPTVGDLAHDPSYVQAIISNAQALMSGSRGAT